MNLYVKNLAQFRAENWFYMNVDDFVEFVGVVKNLGYGDDSAIDDCHLILPYHEQLSMAQIPYQVNKLNDQVADTFSAMRVPFIFFAFAFLIFTDSAYFLTPYHFLDPVDNTQFFLNRKVLKVDNNRCEFLAFTKM